MTQVLLTGETTKSIDDGNQLTSKMKPLINNVALPAFNFAISGAKTDDKSFAIPEHAVRLIFYINGRPENTVTRVQTGWGTLSKAELDNCLPR